MPLAKTVRLPRTATPVFPDRCIGCGRERPGDHFEVAGRAGGVMDFFAPILWLFRRPVRTAAPACGPCRSAANWQRRWRAVVLIAAMSAVIWFCYPWVKTWGLPRLVAKLVVLAVVLVVLFPMLLWQTVRPAAFDITAGADHVDYEFADGDYAREFAAANGTSVRG